MHSFYIRFGCFCPNLNFLMDFLFTHAFTFVDFSLYLSQAAAMRRLKLWNILLIPSLISSKSWFFTWTKMCQIAWNLQQTFCTLQVLSLHLKPVLFMQQFSLSMILQCFSKHKLTLIKKIKLVNFIFKLTEKIQQRNVCDVYEKPVRY